MAEKNADIFAKYGLSSPQSSPKSPGGDVFAKYGLSAPAPKERSIIDEIKSVITGDYPEAQPRSRDEFARDVIDGVGDGIARVVKPVLGALDYVDAPVRQATKVYQDQPESLQFSPKGLIQPVMSGAKFAFDELRGRKSPADAPSFDELYKRTDIGRTLNNPAIAGPTGKFLLNAPGPDVPEEYDINAKELMGRDYDATALEVGRKANELVGGGLLQAAMPSNLVLSAAPKVLEKAKLARDAFKTAGREALAAEKAEQAVTPQIRRAGIIDDVPPGPPKPEAPTISETQVDDARAATTPPEPLPPPESSAALEKYLEQAKGAGYNTDLPQAAELERAERVLGDLKHPILPAQRNATRDMNARDKFRALKESGTATGKQISEFEQLQRQEAVSKIDETINQASPSGVANPDPVAQAENLKKQFLESYENRRTQLGEAFNQYDNVSVDPLEHVPQLTDRIAQEIPGFEKFIESVSDEGVKLKPYSKKLGISRQEYNAISDVVTELGSGPVTVKELRNMRGALLREFPNPLDRPPVVNQLRKAMLNHLEEIIASKHPANREEIFKTFRDYAINEKNLDELEKVFGGSFSEIASGTSKGTVNEKVLDRIFANSRNATIAKNAMGEAAFNEAFASYLAQKRASLTKEGVFSSRRFANWLNTKRTVFQQAGVNPNTLDRLEALTTVLKFTADAPSVNPPGTAKTIGLLKAIGNNAEMPTSVGGILNSAKKVIAGTADDLRRQQGAARTFDELSGVETKGLLEKAGEKLVSPETRALTRKMKKAAKAKADELGKTAKGFIDDEEGKFSPEDLLNILKPGQENVFDLKKARGLVGEPKRGLLEPKGTVIDKASRSSTTDAELVKQFAEKVGRGEPLSAKEARRLFEISQMKNKVRGGGDPMGLSDEAMSVLDKHDNISSKLDAEEIARSSGAVLPPIEKPESPKGLLTSLDVERGPVKELPEAGLLRPKAKGMPVASADNDLAQAKAKYNEMTALRDKGAFNDPEFDKSYGEQYQKDAPRIKAVRYGTPNGNQFVTRVELKNGKTFVGTGPDRKSSIESAFNGGIEHLKSDPTELLKNEKRSEMIVGSNNYIRQKLPFFLLQQNDVYILRHGDHFGALAIPRVGGRDPLYVMGKTIDEALQNLTPFAHSPDGEVIQKTVNPQLTNWLQRWSYQQPKVSLKDALDESTMAAEAVKEVSKPKGGKGKPKKKKD